MYEWAEKRGALRVVQGRVCHVGDPDRAQSQRPTGSQWSTRSQMGTWLPVRE